MIRQLVELVDAWCERCGIAPGDRPEPALLDTSFGGNPRACRPPAESSALLSWEFRHGYKLPHALKTWLSLSDGLFADAPLVHPLSAIGPMVPFAAVPELFIQPESWFELGNPNRETVCIDLGYQMPGGDYPIFTSGDDEQGTTPRIIAYSFESWFLGVLKSGGSEYWLAPNFPSLGDPWEEHRRYVAAPDLAEPLRPFSPRVLTWVREGISERSISERLRISTFDVEAIVRYGQHVGLHTAVQPISRKAL